MEKKGKKSKNKKGLTLLELIMSMAISGIILLAVVGAFATFVSGRRQVREMEQRMENGKSALEYMGKFLRTSCNVRITGFADENRKDGEGKIIYFADQTSAQCVSFEFDPNDKKIVQRIYSDNPAFDLCADNRCNYGVAGTSSELTEGGIIDDAVFNVQNNELADEARQIPRITIKLKADDETLQTTVSARDYSYLKIR